VDEILNVDVVIS